MELNKLTNTLKFSFRELWQQKIFRFAILFNIFYLILSIILTLTVFRNQNDFLVYYEVGEVVLRDINDLYTEPYKWPFRYLPISALYFVPFYLMGFDFGFIVFNLINLILNILICIFLFRIINLVRQKDHEKDDKRVILYISLYMISLPQVFNYILGQINLYITLLMLLSLLIYLKYPEIKWQFGASIILGLSIVIKPITIFMIPFLLVLQIDLKNRKVKFNVFKSLIRLIGIILPLSLNIIMFVIFPRLLKGFLATNFTSSEPSQMNHSFSITKLIINFLYFVGVAEEQVLSIQFYLFLIILIIIALVGFLSLITRKITEHTIIYGYSFGILIMFLSYYDSWDHHLLILTPLLIIILFNLSRKSDITRKFIKPSFFFLSFLDLAFMGLYFAVESYFPFNFASTIFLILIFLGISKFSLNNNSRKK